MDTEECKDEDAEEGGETTTQKAAHKHCKEELDAHQRTHIPFRKWCPHCVGGKCKGAIHKKGQKSVEKVEQQVPVTSLAYMGK